MQIEEVSTEDGLRLDISGKIDSNNSEEFQQIVLQGLRQSDVLILNMENVTYMSSAALRALIMGKKTAASKGSKFVLINTNQTVKSALDITGIAGLLDIR